MSGRRSTVPVLVVTVLRTPHAVEHRVVLHPMGGGGDVPLRGKDYHESMLLLDEPQSYLHVGVDPWI